jgi:hypothetical protein
MVLYLIRVEATYGTTVKVGDRVTAGQRLGIDTDHRTPVLSPADGEVRVVVFDAETHTFVIHVLNRDEDCGFSACGRSNTTFSVRVGGFGQ